MDFDAAELEVIERACLSLAGANRELAAKTDRPIRKNQRMDYAEILARIADRINQDRRMQALVGRACETCD